MSLPSSLRPRGLPSSLKPRNSDNRKKDEISTNLEDQEESFTKSAIRTGLQIPQGITEGTPLGIATNLWQQIGTGESLDPEEIEHIRAISEREGIPFDEEKYRSAVFNASGTIPTVSNIASLIENKTGIPLEAKNDLQKAVRLGSTAGRMSSGSQTQKAVSGVTAPAISYASKQAGVPEPIADILGLGVGVGLGSKTPAYDLKVGPKTKPSGLPERNFESLKQPRKISENRKQRINENLEKDFKKISNDIISTGKTGETAKELSKNPLFKNEIAEKFSEVEKLAESIPEKIPTENLKKILADNTVKKQTSGILPSDYEKDFNSIMKQFIKETSSSDAKAIDLVKQFRKNNKSLGEYFSPEKSRAQNNAKRDALLEYNKGISEIIEKEFPNSEFSNLFKETNKKWSEISDAEYINSFVDNLFDSSNPKFAKAKKFFESDKQKRIFKRALGPDNFDKFETLMQDLLGTETPYKMLQAAKKQGFPNLVKDAGLYMISPKLGAAKTGMSVSKKVYNALIDSILEKPKIVITFKKAVDNLKKGNFSEAEKMFSELKQEIQ